MLQCMKGLQAKLVDGSWTDWYVPKYCTTYSCRVLDKYSFMKWDDKPILKYNTHEAPNTVDKVYCPPSLFIPFTIIRNATYFHWA